MLHIRMQRANLLIKFHLSNFAPYLNFAEKSGNFIKVYNK